MKIYEKFHLFSPYSHEFGRSFAYEGMQSHLQTFMLKAMRLLFALSNPFI